MGMMDPSSDHRDELGHSDLWGYEVKMRQYQVTCSTTSRSSWFLRRRSTSSTKISMGMMSSPAKAPLAAERPYAPPRRFRLAARWPWSSKASVRSSRFGDLMTWFVLLFLKIFGKSKSKRFSRLRYGYFRAKAGTFLRSLSASKASSTPKDPDDEIDHVHPPKDPDDDIDLVCPPKYNQVTIFAQNLLQLSWVATKMERETMRVRLVGLLTILVGLSQLAVAGTLLNKALVFIVMMVAGGLLLTIPLKSQLTLQTDQKTFGQAASISEVTITPQVRSFYSRTSMHESCTAQPSDVHQLSSKGWQPGAAPSLG